MKIHRNITLLAWFNFFLDLRFYAPVAVIYFSQLTDSFAKGMSVFSIAMLSSAIFELPTGIYSDLIGRKKTLVGGAIFSLLSVTLYALANSYWILAVGALFEGVARAFYSGNNEALITDTLAEIKLEREYAEHYGRTTSMFQWALAISALIGGVIASISFTLVMWLSVIPAILALSVSFAIVEPNVHIQKSGNILDHLKEALRFYKDNSKLRILSLSNAIGFAQGEAGYQFRSAFIVTLWPVWAIGLAQMLSNIGAALSFRFGGKIIGKYRSLPVLYWGKVYSLVSNTVATLFPSGLSPILLSSNSLTFGSGVVAMSDLLQKEYSANQRSTMGSLNSLFSSFAFAIVSLGLGLFADTIGPAKALLSLQVLALVSTLLLWKLFGSSER